MYYKIKDRYYLIKQAKPDYILGLVWLILITTIGYFPFQFNDTDVYYFIANGNYILDHGIPFENPFISTPGYGITIQNWLYCVLISFVYRYLHTAGLFILQTLFLFGMLFVTLKFFDYTLSKHKILIGCFTISIFYTFTYISLRPQILTYILILIELIGIKQFKQTGRSKYLYLIPLTILIEINCHASYWIMHYIVLLPYVLEIPKCLPLERDHLTNKELSKFIVPIVLSVIALFLNPYGEVAIAYVFIALSSGAVALFHISEQCSFQISNGMSLLFILSIVIFVILLINRKLKSSEAYMFLGFSILFLFAIKWIPFYIIGLLYLYQALLRVFGSSPFTFKIPKPAITGSYFIIAIAFGLFLAKQPLNLYFDLHTNEYIDTHWHSGAETFDKFADYLDEHTTFDSSVYTSSFADENYFEYRGYKVYIDARPEIYAKGITKDETVLSNFLATISGADSLAYYKNTKDISVLYAPADYFIDDAEYHNLMYEEVATDYYVVDISDTLKYMYFKTHPDYYELCLTDSTYLLYKRI